MSQQKQLMFIAWKWDGLEQTINQKAIFEPEPFNIKAWKGEAYEEFKVKIRKSSGEISADPNGSKIIRIRIREEESKGMLSYILQIVRSYKKDNQKVFLFLHRTDGFTTLDVQKALENDCIDKCFLFGSGRDFIYYDTQDTGLLGDNGYFHSQKGEPGRPDIKVADEEKKTVFQPYFKKVWDYYEHEFVIKITELRADLLSYLWGNSFPDNRIWQQKNYSTLLQNEPLLHLRLKCFMDDEDGPVILNDTERAQLIMWEKQQQKSLVFDDCRKNMANTISVKQEYEVLHKKLTNLFFFEDSNYASQKTIVAHLQDLSLDFDKLLLIIEKNTNV